MRRSLMITGGAGVIGASFTWFWAHHHPEDAIVVVDSLTYAGSADNIRGLLDENKVALQQVDIRDEGEIAGVFRAYAVDTVVHFAAESHVDRSIDGPRECVSTNVIGTQVLLDCARRAWASETQNPERHRFHHVSTDEVYGSLGFDSTRFTETTPYAPRSPYSASKAASDHLVRAYGNTYGLPWSISNCSNNYGPYQYPEKLIPLAIVNMLLGRPVGVYGNGRNVRDWLHVHDHCRALEAILLSGPLGETFNIAGEAERANIDLVTQLAELVDKAFRADDELCRRYARCPAATGGHCSTLIGFVRDRPGHDLRYANDTRKIAQMLGFVPSVDLERGLAETLRWYMGHHQWWYSRLSTP
jgi:dTDP-glucose 4,6-dehydratase